MTRRLVNIYEISKEEYDQLYQLKAFCENQKHCHDCKIKSECKNIGSAWRGNDISCLTIGKVGKDEVKYVIFGEGL